MQFYGIVHSIASEKKTTLEKLSISLGKTPNYISTQKSRGSSPKVDTASTIVSSCGYKLCAIPSGSVPESAYVISPTNEE